MNTIPQKIPAAPTGEQSQYLEWGKALFQSSISSLNEAQRHMTGISVSLLGGSLVFYGNSGNKQGLYLCCITFLLAAIASVIGTFPYTRTADLFGPNRLSTTKQLMRRMYLQKLFWCTTSYVLVGLGLLAAIVIEIKQVK